MTAHSDNKLSSSSFIWKPFKKNCLERDKFWTLKHTDKQYFK